MQASNEEGKQPSSADPELSEAWRVLLGSQSLDESKADPAVQVQPLASDPWSSLLNSQGMQPIDLQKAHLHDLQKLLNDEDVEHALNIIREATGQLKALDGQAEEK